MDTQVSPFWGVIQRISLKQNEKEVGKRNSIA